jgi:predicted AAA+ superfamily ATPase
MSKNMVFVHRNMSKKLENSLKTFSAVYLAGARQCGKSTFVNTLLSSDNANKITFDTMAMRTAAETDPEGFVNNLPKDKLNVIDEVQRVPEVYLKLKKDIDDKRLEGNGKNLFLLTGSANILALPNLAKAMVGRMAILTMYPFSLAEANNSDRNFIDRLWNENLVIKSYKPANLVKAITSATFPEVSLGENMDRSIWFDSYIDLILQRDAVEFAKIRKPAIIRQLIAILQPRSDV